MEKAVVLMLALIVCISSIVVPQPEEVSAKQAVYLDYYGKDKPKIKSCLQHRMMPNGIKQMKAAVMFPKQWNIQSLSLHEKKTVYAGEKFTIVPVAMFKNGVVVGSKTVKTVSNPVN